VPWLQPYPDRLLAEAAAPRDGEPDARLIAKETIELAYIVALQFLPPKQRVALILCDVLDWSAQETATLLETTIPAVNGALRRARAAIRDCHALPPRSSASQWSDSTRERALLQQYVTATEQGDAAAIVHLLRDDVRHSMPPQPGVWTGKQAVVDAWVTSGFGSPPYDDFKCVITSANRMPCVVAYLKGPGEREYHPLAMDVLRIEDELIAEITTFGAKDLLDAFALPRTLH
jgi:RNA polymerase sigma-70 factor (ECF subfamily)